MDNQPRTPTKPSGIPRPAPRASRLPLPSSTASKSLKPSPSRERLQADPGLDATKLRRPSEDSVFKKPALPRPSSSLKGTYRRSGVPQTGVSDIARQEAEELDDDTSTVYTNGSELDDVDARGRTMLEKPSLSDRTIETLSKIPPSPGPSRQSSFFNATSPIRSPSRPTSSMTNYSRSPSRSSFARQPIGSDLLSSQQPSTMRLPSRSRISATPTLPTNIASTDQDSVAAAPESPSKLKRPSTRTSLYGGIKSTGTTAPKPRQSLSRPPSVKPTESNMAPPSQTLQVKKTRKVPSNSSLKRSPSSADSRKSSATSTAPDLSAEQQSEIETRKGSKSSNALRESIAKAKAARKAAAQNTTQTTAAPADPFDITDPFNQQPNDSNHGLFRKRVESARTSGNLNIAAMSLTEIPQEVMTMYEFNPDSSTDWYECVDLVKFIAADNELTEMPDAAFPDVNPEDVDYDSDEKGNQFGGLEILDLHGNLLRSLPMGFRRLQHLHSLNLSNNQLTTDDLHVVWEMEWLRDLKLAKNQLQGAFPSAIGKLRGLEALDLHENSLAELPEELGELSALRSLDVGHNVLVTLPFEALSRLPLKDIRAPKNKLAGTLIPASVQQFSALQNMDVVNNALEKLSDNDKLELPNLQTLSLSVNRIKSLPDVSTWQALLSLLMEDNSLSEIPQGFIELKSVRNVDFTGNDILRLDEKIGLMDNLVTFRIANNPLRERKFLNMSTDEIKQALRNRCEPEIQADTDDDEGSVATQFTLAPETRAETPAETSAANPPKSPAKSTTASATTSTTSWQIRPGGVLDRSYTETRELETEQLEGVANSQDIRCLYLQHNEISHFPVPALSMLAHSLIDLDLSHNALNSSALFSSSVSLPNLQNLTLNSTGLSSMEPILTNLSAPLLTFLDVSINRLAGNLPAARQTYSNLKTFIAADNQFDSLEFEAVQGLQVLDVGNNNINALPPKIGLLRAEGSSKNWGGGSALRRFEVAGNTFRVPRWQTVAKGTDAVLEWLKDRISAKELRELESDDEGDFEE
ncbi:uncharacterized protein ASPGLDRAFT_125268 [Aspergillus glaucus CBS 516.65]|uniref:Leucine-rich repeat-containing protein 40 n=1 Tax=Aspergillus glaucus CBS 516.65 TaxID=1160497 RepID=A0A1L9VLQ0_ASPGL|nr:hypothetical protein ASPGLDRAFT_125268 [Aspergillus glaucus CBS 516.65]OJJ84856.1 hypothetical protein ASPGLDRAFT_125268 [Aspergillus glaucus CBS 516.65]